MKAQEVPGPAQSGVATKRIGLVAGGGRFPIHFAQAARQNGFQVVAVAIHREASPELEGYVDRLHWVKPGQLDKLIDTFQAEGIRDLVLAGKVAKARIFSGTGHDRRLASLLDRLPHKDDDTLLRALAHEIEAQGIAVRESTTFLSHLLPERGHLSSRRPTEKEQRDVDYGYRIAKAVSALGVGQTVVVKDGVTLAVEAIEGTDQAIHRGSMLGKGDVVVVKVSSPKQDIRFDMPVIGPHTIDCLTAAGARVLAVEAGYTVILERDEVVRKADGVGLAIVAI